MVSTTPVGEPTVAQIQGQLVANTHGWLTTTSPHMAISYSGLAALVRDIITAYTAELRSRLTVAESGLAGLRDHMGLPDDCDWTTVVLLAKFDHDLAAERDTFRAQRAALWDLLKDRVRAVIQLCQQNSELHTEWWYLRIALLTALGYKPGADDNPADDQLISELRELARESELRESEIISLTVERDNAEARLSDLDTTTSGGVQ